MAAAGPTPLSAVADAIKSGAVRKLVALTGAGCSVAAGIPDFRSPGGMYDTLRPELLTATEADRDVMRRDPTWVVNKELFTRNQFPYCELRRPFIVGIAESKWKPTAGHYFFKIAHDKGILHRLYTQNIDGLDHALGLPPAKVVSVHGTMGKIRCEACGAPGPDGGSPQAFAALVRSHIKDIYKQDPAAPAESTPINCEACGKPQLKPATVLYGGAMPQEFFAACDADFDGDAPAAPDMMIVAGTSLQVFPAASLPGKMPPGAPVVLVNKEPVGMPGMIFLQGACDEQLLWLCAAVGWLDDMVAAADAGKLAPGSTEFVKKFAATHAEFGAL